MLANPLGIKILNFPHIAALGDAKHSDVAIFFESFIDDAL
jgi:hypothetical protein